MRSHFFAGLGVDRDQVHTRAPRRRIGDVAAHAGHRRRPRRKGDKLTRGLQIWRTRRDDELARVQHLTVPDDGKRLLFQDLRVEYAPVVRGGHHHFAIGEHLRRLRTGLPPNHLILDGVELAEGAIDPLRRVERGVHLVPGHSVGHQGELQVDGCHAPHPAPAWERFKVEKIGDGLWFALLKILRVVRIDGRVEQRANTALAHSFRVKVVLGRFAVRPRRQLKVQHFEEALVAAGHSIGELHVYHVPIHGPRIHLGAQLGEAAVVVLQANFNARLFRKCLVITFYAGARIRAAPRHHGQGFRNGRRTPHQRG